MDEVSNLILHSSHSEIAINGILEGKYIDFVSLMNDNSNDYNNDFLVFHILSLNRIVGININGALNNENININDYTIINLEMALEIFIDSDINITNYKSSYDYQGLYVSSDSEDNLSVSLNSSVLSNSICSDLVSHQIKMNSGLENNSNIYCYFNSAIQMFIHDSKIRDAIKSFDDTILLHNNEWSDNELVKYQLMNYFKELIIMTENKYWNINIKSELLTKIRDLLISKVTTLLDNNHGQEDSNQVYNIIFSFFKDNSNLINNNLLADALNLYGSNVCTMKCLVCKIIHCKGLNNSYLKNDISDIYNEIRIEQPDNIVLQQFIDNKLSIPNGLNYYQTSITEIESDELYKETCSDCFSNSRFFNHQKRIVKYPQILTISMQRFAFGIGQQLLDPFMHFPLQVSLKELELLDVDTLDNFENYLDQFEHDSIYYLSKFVQHRGNSLQSGHYHAYVLDTTCNLWYCYNDNTVTLMTSKEIEIEIATTINNNNLHKGIQYAFYEKDIINKNITCEGFL